MLKIQQNENKKEKAGTRVLIQHRHAKRGGA